jgi:hypothetical protein
VTYLLTEVEPWLTGVLLAVVMLVAWAVGHWWGKRHRKNEPEVRPSKLNDATLALMGLLLAFSFSMALVKHEQRRQFVVTNSNAIETFYASAGLLKEPLRGKLQDAIRRYLDHRLELVRLGTVEATSQVRIDEVNDMHREMQELVREAADTGTPFSSTLANNMNAVVAANAARVAGLHDRLPPSILLLLFTAAVIAIALAGRQQGASGDRRFGAAIGFTVLVSMVVWITVDLNQPRRGLITVSQEPMERLQKELK